ncbi:MAG: YicC/YloC family endoribonuclease [Pseudomonadota bacterium]
MTEAQPSISSMTGFARVEAQHEMLSFQIEARCVNGRSADIRLRLPSGWEVIESPVRSAFQRVVRRGNANVTISVTRENRRLPKINKSALEALKRQAFELAETHGEKPPSLAELLRLPGVVEMSDSAADNPWADGDLKPVLMSAVEKCASDLAATRNSEGAALATVLSDLFDAISAESKSLGEAAQVQRGELAERLETQLAELLGDKGGQLDPSRLHQEIALLVSKADIAEELARLHAHVDAGRRLLTQAEPVGRKLDFLAQELNREANTVCSKAASLAITQHGLALKALIDQVKEQVQNVE